MSPLFIVIHYSYDIVILLTCQYPMFIHMSQTRWKDKMEDNIIRFKRDTAFRKQLFTGDSFAHPAKLDSQLLLWLVEKFTKPGETILDCMAGSGTVLCAKCASRHELPEPR